MIIRNASEQHSKNQERDQLSTAANPLSPSKSPQSIVFPYTGPPGTGPGLLGSKPGVGNIEYLIALEQHATSLKSALMIAAALKNSKNKNVEVEIEYDSLCDIESELNGEYGVMSSD